MPRARHSRTSQRPQRFNFSQAMVNLCDDMSHRLEAFHHLAMEEVAVTFAQTRSLASHGLQAKLTPMRFEDGALEMTADDGQRWTVRRLYRDRVEILYILTFYLPRFLNQSFREKLITVVHELYHISPYFNGDIRRLSGRYHVHSHSQKEYDLHMAEFVDQYLSQNPPRELYQFLEYDFETLQQNYGTVFGMKLPIPKLVPIGDQRFSA